MSIRIIEVGPRDGLQNESVFVPTDVKARFVSALAASGLTEIEATSFVSPKWVPQLADASELWPLLPEGIQPSALVPNLKGLERAIEAGVDRIALFTAASEEFTQRNINMSISDSLKVFAHVISEFRKSSPTGWVRGYVSTAFECPFAGGIQPKAVVSVAAALFELGVDEVSIGDTIGSATPSDVSRLVDELPSEMKAKCAWHFHDTWGTGIANVQTALDLGCKWFDSSAAGLGGCPYAPGAAGNIATEDLVFILERQGVRTGVDLDRLARASLEVLGVLGRVPAAKAQVASLGSRPRRSDER